MNRETVVLTPEMARNFLDSLDERQRKLNPSEAAKIARDIVRDGWVYSPLDAIGISEYGKLIDGQHRCAGVVMANKPVKTDVVYGLPDYLFERLDQNKPRKVSDFVKCKNATVVSSLARFIVCYKDGATITDAINGRVGTIKGNKDKAKLRPSNKEILDYIQSDLETLEKIGVYAVSCYHEVNVGGKAIYADAIWLIMNRYDNVCFDTIEAFVEDVQKTVPSSEYLAWLKNNLLKEAYKARVKNQRLTKEYSFLYVLAMLDGYINQNAKQTSIKKVIKATEKKYNKKFVGVCYGTEQ